MNQIPRTSLRPTARAALSLFAAWAVAALDASSLKAEQRERPIVLAQAGSAGGTIGKQGKSVSGGEEQTGRPARSNIQQRQRSTVIAPSTISVRSASYGMNCNPANANNVVAHIKSQCDGQQRCDYLVNHHVIGDPAVFCGKDYVVTYVCGPLQTKQARVGPEASGKVASLSCSGQ